MKRSYLVSLILGLGGLLVLGFSLGFFFHMNTAIQKFATEVDRTSGDYDFSYQWYRPPDGSQAYLLVLAKPNEKRQATFQGHTRWRWSVSNPNQPCDPDDHTLIWRYGKDRWELLDDLSQDLSVPLFESPNGEGGSS